jgi:hypothetical protein
LNWSFYDESEYTEGTGTRIEVYNPTNKSIKYLWFSFVGYNAVDDILVIVEQVQNYNIKRCRSIKPDENGSYEFY